MASQRIGYFSLPREVRDMVMALALQPGIVFIPATRYDQATKSGVQLLATCSQAYIEGYQLYYGRNTFFIGPCCFRTLRHFLDAYQPKHIAAMHRLVIECTIQDVPSSEHKTIWAAAKEDATRWLSSPDIDVPSTSKAQMVGPLPSSTYASDKVRRMTEEYRREAYRERLGIAVEAGWRAKILWLQEEILRGQCMHVSMKPSSEYEWSKCPNIKLKTGEGFGSLVLEMGKVYRHGAPKGMDNMVQTAVESMKAEVSMSNTEYQSGREKEPLEVVYDYHEVVSGKIHPARSLWSDQPDWDRTEAVWRWADV